MHAKTFLRRERAQGAPTARSAAAAQGPLPPAALHDGDPPVLFRRTVWVAFAQHDLSGKITHPSAPKARKVSRAAAMQEIADWLEKLGMSEYGPRFAENDMVSCPTSRTKTLRRSVSYSGIVVSSCVLSPT